MAKVSALAKQPLDFRPQSRGSQRLLEWAAQGDIHDERLWMPIAAATGAAGNTSALVGTPDQVAEALLAYYDLGVSTILIRGFDPLPDAVEYGRELIPAVRAEAAKRDAARAPAARPAARGRTMISTAAAAAERRVRDYAAMGLHRTGWPADDRAAEWLIDELHAAGIEAHAQPFRAPRWGLADGGGTPWAGESCRASR